MAGRSPRNQNANCSEATELLRGAKRAFGLAGAGFALNRVGPRDRADSAARVASRVHPVSGFALLKNIEL